MMVTLGAHLEIVFKILLIENIETAFTFMPQSVRDSVRLLRRMQHNIFLFAKPGHCSH